MPATNRRLVGLDGPDYYPTPAWATRALLHYEKFPGKLAEPCAGEHYMADVLSSNGYWPICSDIIDYGYGDIISDFRLLTGPFDTAITNPPFKLAEDLIDHLMTIVQVKFALLLKLSFLTSDRRYRKYYETKTLARVWVFSQRLSMYPDGVKGDQKEGTTAYGWFIWDKYRTNIEPELKFIAPVFKDD